jgi:hypothetical protein
MLHSARSIPWVRNSSQSRNVVGVVVGDGSVDERSLSLEIAPILVLVEREKSCYASGPEVDEGCVLDLSLCEFGHLLRVSTTTRFSRTSNGKR